MAGGGNHYERAFADFLQGRGSCFTPLIQYRRVWVAGKSWKNFDFLVHRSRAADLLIDVKGRKLSYQTFCRGRLGPSWATLEDVSSLRQWQQWMPSRSVGAFVFAYWLHDLADGQRISTAGAPLNMDVYYTQGRGYVFSFIDVNAYSLAMKPRSERWNTVDLPARLYRLLAEPVGKQFGSRRGARRGA